MSRENDRPQQFWKEPPKETSYEAHLRRKRLKQQQRSRSSKAQLPGQQDYSLENYETPSTPSRQSTRLPEDYAGESYETEPPRRTGQRPSTPTDVYDTEYPRQQDTRPRPSEEMPPYDTGADQVWDQPSQHTRARIDRRSTDRLYRPPDRANKAPVVRDRRVAGKTTRHLPQVKQRRAWPWMLAGCAGGILTIALIVAIVLVIFFHSTLGGTLFGGVFNKTFTQKNTQTFSISNFSLIQINNKVGGVASNVTIIIDPTASMTTVTTVKKVQAGNQSDANKALAGIPLILSPVSPTTPTLILTICSQTNTICGNLGDSVDVTITLPTSTNANAAYLFDIEIRVGNLSVQQAQLDAGSCLSTGTGNVTFKGNFDTTNSSNLNPCGQPTSNAHPWYKIHSEVGNLDLTPFPTLKNMLLDTSTTAGKINSDGFNLPIQTSNGSDTYYGPLIPNTSQPTAQLTLDVGTGDINLHKL